MKFSTDDRLGEKGFASFDRVIHSTESEGTGGVVSIPEGAHEEGVEDDGLDLQMSLVSEISDLD